jgi:hypothetical protein
MFVCGLKNTMSIKNAWLKVSSQRSNINSSLEVGGSANMLPARKAQIGVGICFVQKTASP